MAYSGKVFYKDECLQGIIIQETPYVILKLDSGYNLVLDKKKVKKIEKGKNIDFPVLKKPKKGSGKKITILHTGGTIASKVDYSIGGVTAQIKPEELLSMYPEMSGMADISCVLLGNMHSEMMRFSHYNTIARAIKKQIDKGAEGIIVTQGTDTLHYTSAALSFALENLGVPVVVVGSQRSSDRPSSDARLNMTSALHFILKARSKGVFVCMHESSEDKGCLIIQGTDARKMHTSRRDAFKSINSLPVARVSHESSGYRLEEFRLLQQCKGAKQDKMKLRLFDEGLKIGLLKIHTNMYAGQFAAFNDFDGLLIEGTGLGHAPIAEVDSKSSENKKIFEMLKKLCRKMPVAMASQCINGRINMNVYSTGRALIDEGMLGNLSCMTPETAYIKLAWLLSNYKQVDEKAFAELYSSSLRGENNARLVGDEFG